MINNIKLSACIVTYNCADKIEQTVKSVVDKSQNLNLKLYISDNNSTDNTLEIIRENFPTVTILENGGNKGFGWGHNKVLDIIDSEYHFVINPDILVKDDTFETIINYLEKEKSVNLLCPKIMSPDGNEQMLALSNPKVKYLISRYFNIKKDWQEEYTKANERDKNIIDIQFCTGCFMAIRTKVFKELGGFDERFFMYFEDADLTRRVNLKSRAVMLRETEVIHLWERAHTGSLKYFKIIIVSMFKYFRKWRKK
ncbi:MAG: glycosyltransferase family 2 protein [Clostridia bacterium]